LTLPQSRHDNGRYVSSCASAVGLPLLKGIGMSTRSSRPGLVIPLANLSRADRETVGPKAANLGELLRAGLPVLDGFVVVGAPAAELSTDAEAAVRAAANALGDVPLAVRSSAAAEDLADASFAGQYETVLNVHGPEALLTAIRDVRASAENVRVQRYRAARGIRADARLSVLVQRMLAPEAAGVAFTANPVSGRRDEVVITAGRGLGERVVSGEAVGDEWTVRDGTPKCGRSVEAAIDAPQAVDIARLARRVAAHFGPPQDIEWAIEAGHLYVLQARPMTALPEPVEWMPPAPGYWMRNLRLGEWLPGPMTPLFQDWLLVLIETGYLDGMRATAGTAVAFRYTSINGWYYTSPPRARSLPGIFLRALVQGRGRVVNVLLNGVLRPRTDPVLADRALLGRLARHWREQLLPRYREIVAKYERQVEAATAAQLQHMVDTVGTLAGEYLWSLAIVGGAAWKMEGCLATFVRKHLADELEVSVQVLLRGLPDAELTVPAHAVQSVDWYWPTAGEQQSGRDLPDAALGERRQRVAQERERAEAACRRALADRPPALARFEALLEVAQRYARLREEQARWFTLGWPLQRRCALQLGRAAQEAGVVDARDDIFFLNRQELFAESGRSGLHEVVARRRAEWERQRRLLAPLTIGQAPQLLERSLTGVVDAVRTCGQMPEGAIVGQPASPGRASGPVRVVRGPQDFDQFKAGEVLVAKVTAPAWTPLFGRAAAVVTDGGSLAAHASLVAREYGIPAVVATGDATRQLRDGQNVTVDGSAGFVQADN
jgi:rifampicin phosphotransferase